MNAGISTNSAILPQKSQSNSFVHTEALKLHRPVQSDYRTNLIEANQTEYYRAFAFYEQFVGAGKWTKYHLFLGCRTSAYFSRQKSTGLVRIIANSCHLRWCPFCSKSKANIIRRNTRDWLKKVNYPKFITLTLSHSPTPLIEQIDKLYASFKQLRRIKMFKHAAKSGVWFFQVTKSNIDGNWHPHLHVITGGLYIPQRALRREWERITDTSFIVDIRMIKDPDIAADYVARYATKACNPSKFSLDELNEIDEAIKKHRVCGSWGSAKKAKLTLLPKMIPDDWQMLGRFSTVIGLLKIDDNAAKIYEAYKSGLPLGDGIDVNDFDAIRDGKPPPENSNYEVAYEND